MANKTVIELFSGPGGLSLGFERGGFRILQAIEKDKKVEVTYKHNHPDVDFIQGDITSICPAECLARIGLLPGQLTAVIGGPPCQGFSESNRRTRNLENPQNHLYKRYFHFLEQIQPEWFVMENVAGLRTLSRGAVLEAILGEAERLGYTADVAVLNAAEYGVPQIRRRIFIVGNRVNLPIEFPQPTHGGDLLPFVTVEDAIRDLPLLENGAATDCLLYRPLRRLSAYQLLMRANSRDAKSVYGNLVTRSSEDIIARYRHIRRGQNWEAVPRELMACYEDVTRCHTGLYYRLKWNESSKVIGNFRKNMLIHPEKHRGLSIREAARLQSFPDNYRFLGSIGFQQQQVADAVPPLLAEAVARAVISVIEREERRRAERGALTVV